MRSSIIIATTLTLLSTAVSAGTSGMITQVKDATDFCVFLPPNSDTTDRLISDTEWDAQAFCMGSTPEATGAGTLPSGFITSAHFIKTDAYVQITGTMDYSKAKLSASDQGGQYDIKAPTGSSCAGWDYYVNLIEPNSGTYCIRCCNDTTNCNRGISQDGCAKIIPGDYSGPSSKSGATTAAAATTAATADSKSTKAATTENSSKADSSKTTPSASKDASSATSSVDSSVTSSIISSAASSAPNSAETSSTGDDNTVSAQSVNAAGSVKPMSVAVAVAAGLLISAVAFSA